MTNWIRRGLRLRTAWRRAALVGCLLALSGCGSGFFNPSSTGTGSGGGGTGGTPPPPSGSSLDSIYVANGNSSLQTIAGFSLSSAGALANLTVSPNTVGTLPSSLAINPAGSLVWVGSLLGQLEVYVVNSNGTLSLGNNNQPVESDVSASSMVVDPSGNYLLVLSNTGSLGGGATSAPTISVYQIDQSSGALTQLSENGSPTVALDNGSGFQIVFAPNGTQVYVALGTGGVDALTFNPANGGLGKLAVHLPPAGLGADQGLAFDPQGHFLFVAETGVNGVRVLTINPDSTLNEVAGSPYPTGLGAKSVVVDSTGAYVYVGNSTTNTISGFSLSSTGTLAPLAGSPYVTGSSPYSLAEDNTGAYLVAACTGGNPDLQVFSITGATGATPGALVSVTTASTGNANPAGASALAVTP